MITMEKVKAIATDYCVNPMSLEALFRYSKKIFLMGAEHQLLSGWVKPVKALPRHLQDCMVCRLVDGAVRVSQSQYYAGKITTGFFDLDDGESFYIDDEILYWMPINLDDICAEIQKKEGEK